MKTFLLKHKFLIVVILTVIISFTYAFYNQKGKGGVVQTEPSPNPVKQANYQSLVPGISNKNNVIEKLGEPDKTEDNGNTLKYTSSNPNVPNEVVIKEDKVSIIKEAVTLSDKIYISDIENEYGETDSKLYGPHSQSGFDLYVLPKNGIAFVGNKESGLILEIWYFPPTTFEEFKREYTSQYNYSSTPSRQY